MSDIQKLFKDITLKIANHLDIKIHNVSETEFNELTLKTGTSTAGNTYIHNGELYLNDKARWSMAIHELLHIAVVENKFRKMMNHDTQDSYSSINKLDPERKHLRSESATLGLQYHVYKHFNLSGFLGGGFFTGYIRTSENETNVPCIWRDKALQLFEELNIGSI